jgi:hypothetical protein
MIAKGLTYESLEAPSDFDLAKALYHRIYTSKNLEHACSFEFFLLCNFPYMKEEWS